jgi:hypothetical protein
MPINNPKRQKEVAKIGAQFTRYERATRWILTLVVVLLVLALVSPTSLILEL